MNNGIKTTQTPGPPTTTTVETPKCTCCMPPQLLEAPETGQTEYTCPVTGQKYTFDPAEGVVQMVAGATQNQNVGAADRELFPKAPRREDVRRVNPEEPFA